MRMYADIHEATTIYDEASETHQVLPLTALFNNKIPLIKAVRAYTGASLAESKGMVDRFFGELAEYHTTPEQAVAQIREAMSTTVLDCWEPDQTSATERIAKVRQVLDKLDRSQRTIEPSYR